MSEKPISPLRQRMLEDMNMRRFVPDTQREYIRAVKRLAIFLGRSPDTATAEELRAFQLHLTETGAQSSSINAPAIRIRAPAANSISIAPQVPEGAVDGCRSGAMETAAKRASSACRCIGPGSKARTPVRACRRQAVIRLR